MITNFDKSDYLAWGIVALSILLTIIVILGCGDEGDSERFSITHAEHEVAVLGNEKEGVHPVVLNQSEDQTVHDAVTDWTRMEREGLQKQLEDGIITEAQYHDLLNEVYADALHMRNKHNLIDFNISSTGEGGWSVAIVYRRAMTIDEFVISIKGHYDVEDFASVERDDGNWDVKFTIATETSRGILDFPGLTNSLDLAGN